MAQTLARDAAGNIWDTSTNPPTFVRSGALGQGRVFSLPPNPKEVRQEQRANEADTRAAAADARAADAARREAAAWNASHNPDGSPKVQAPSLLGNPNLTGPEYLASLPQNIRNRVKQLIEGRSLLTAREKGQPLGQQLMDAANQADPTFDENVMHARYLERQQYTGQGKGSLTVQAAERLAQHINDLYAASKALGGPDLGFSPLSNLATGTSNLFKQRQVASYNQILPLISGELQKLTKNGSATVDESNKIEHNLRADQPEAVRNDAIKEIVRLGRAQYDPLRQSWASAWQGSTPPPMPMDFSPATTQIFDNIEAEGPPLRTKRDRNGTLIALTSDGATPGSGPSAPPPVKPVDYSGMGGGPSGNLAATDPNSKLGAFKQTYRNEYDPSMAATLSAFIKKGAPYSQAAAYAQTHGFNPPKPSDYMAAVRFAANHGGATNVEANRLVPTTLGERVASSPAAAALTAALSSATAGFNDTAGRAIAGDAYDANRAALAATNPGADVAGNLIGGAAGAIAAPELAGKYFPKAAKFATQVAAKLGKFAPAAGDAAYAGIYGANENPDNPGKGAFSGALTGAVAGPAGRALARGVGNVIAPPAGDFGPAYAQNVFPSPGQRFAKSGIVGRAINTAEQAMQSMPLLGAAVARARDVPRDAAQLGAFNEGLGELKPFDAVLGTQVSRLPGGMKPGTEPHAFTQKAFSQAYDHARSGMQFVPDQPYIADHAAFNQQLNSGVLNDQQAGQVQKVIANTVGSRLPGGGGAMNGEAYKKASSELSSTIDKWSRDPNMQSAANALSDYQSIFDSAARRNSDPAAVNLLDAADRGYAKYARVRNAGARVGGDAGTFTMKNLDRAVQQEGGGVASGPFQRGQALMQDYSKAIQPLGDTLSNSGTGERLLTNRMFLGEQAGAGVLGGNAILGGLTAHPALALPFAAYAPGVSDLVSRAIAPRGATLSPALAGFLEAQAARARFLAPYVGKAAVPAVLAYRADQ